MLLCIHLFFWQYFIVLFFFLRNRKINSLLIIILPVPYSICLGTSEAAGGCCVTCVNEETVQGKRGAQFSSRIRSYLTWQENQQIAITNLQSASLMAKQLHKRGTAGSTRAGMNKPEIREKELLMKSFHQMWEQTQSKGHLLSGWQNDVLPWLLYLALFFRLVPKHECTT